MRTFATIAASLAMSLAAIGLAVAAPGKPASASLRAASGTVGISNSQEGDHILAAGNMRPGDGVTGTVTIGNDGDVAGRFRVAATHPADTPGPYGGRLSGRMVLTLDDVTRGVTIFAGPPSAFAAHDVGTFAPGEEREFRFTMTLPQTAGNAYLGSALSLGFKWSAGAVAVATPKPKPPKPIPTPPAVPPAPAAPGTADVLGLPAATKCVKRGKLKVKLRAPAGTKIVSASLGVNGKVKRLKGAKVRKPVSLRGLRKRTKVTLTVRLSDGRTYKASRTYRACR
jgi:hypothetical protein